MGWFDGRPSHSRSHSHSHAHSTSSHHGHFSSSARPTYSRAGSSYSRSSSYYKRRPRDGYINRLIYKLKQLLRSLLYYARRNPIKLGMILMPLITGGALYQIARQFGIRLPAFFAGGAGHRGHGGGYYGSSGYERDSGFGGFGGFGGRGGTVSSLMSVARAFM